MLKLLTVLGAKPPKSYFIGFAFKSVLTLLSKSFVLVCSILHCCMVSKIFWLFITLFQYQTKLSYLQFENMGVAVARLHPKCGRSCT